MDIYIIHDNSLDTRKENVQHIKETLKNIKQIENINIIDKFDYKTINNEQVKAVIRSNKPEKPTEIDDLFSKFIKPININNISNYLKHICAYECIIKSNKPAIIIEDDVIISNDIHNLIEKIYESNHDIVLCGHPFSKEPKETFTPIEKHKKILCYSHLVNHIS